MTEVRRFSPWCQLCLDGDPRPDAHEYHALQMLQERAKRVSALPWRWKLVDEKPPVPGKTAQGESASA